MVRAADTAATCGGADWLTHRKSIHVKRHTAAGASVSPAECDAGSAEQELVRDADHGVGVRLPHIDHPSVVPRRTTHSAPQATRAVRRERRTARSGSRTNRRGWAAHGLAVGSGPGSARALLAASAGFASGGRSCRGGRSAEGPRGYEHRLKTPPPPQHAGGPLHTSGGVHRFRHQAAPHAPQSPSFNKPQFSRSNRPLSHVARAVGGAHPAYYLPSLTIRLDRTMALSWAVIKAQAGQCHSTVKANTYYTPLHPRTRAHWLTPHPSLTRSLTRCCPS